MKKVLFYIILMTGVFFASCSNNNWDFPNHYFSTVFFGTQDPVRIITLGTDYQNDNTLDNKRQFQIVAAVSGFREVPHDVIIEFEVDNSLLDGVANLKPMPAHYYSILSDRILIRRGGRTIGGVTVQLTDAFFASQYALGLAEPGRRPLQPHYVIPVRMTRVTGADYILSGTPAVGVDNPNRLREDDWDVLPKDFVLMGLRYINPWDGMYLRTGVDLIDRIVVEVVDGGETTVTVTERDSLRTVPQRWAYIERAEVIRLTSYSLNELVIPLSYRNDDGTDLGMELRATFNANQEAVVSLHRAQNPALANIRVFDVTVTGSGRYVVNGARNSFGQRDRDVLSLEYTVEFSIETYLPAFDETLEDDTVIHHPARVVTEWVKYVTTDEMILRDRGFGREFLPSIQWN